MANEERSLSMEQLIKQAIYNVRVTFTYRLTNGTPVQFKHPEQEIQVFDFDIDMQKSPCRHVSEHPNGGRHS
jgi:hypothetical protein